MKCSLLCWLLKANIRVQEAKVGCSDINVRQCAVREQLAVRCSAGVLSVLTAVMSQFCVLLDSAEEDGGLLRFVCLQTNIHSDIKCGRNRGRAVLSVNKRGRFPHLKCLQNGSELFVYS